MNRTGIVKDIRYMDHDMGSYHPESPERLKVVYEMLDGTAFGKNFIYVPVRSAEREELLFIHTSRYIDLLASTDGKENTYLDPDTQTSEGSYRAALLAAGGLCEAISMVHSGELKNAFALVRPPGHHAEKSRAMGFCLFNNVAIGARYSQVGLGLNRVLIVDWDLHHGNGTQHSFEDDPSILYFSTHQYPYYPGSGSRGEVGRGEGEGYTINVPLSTGYGDGEYIAIFEELLKPVALEFKPEIILVSAGFDTYMGDPLGGMSVTPEGYAGLTRSLMDIAEACCGGKVVITLEGGYNLQGMVDSTKAVLEELAGITFTTVSDQLARSDREMVDYALGPVKEIHKKYWKGLN
jgi:acetoin utilization deacetylase AcuC-like enzyme